MHKLGSIGIGLITLIGLLMVAGVVYLFWPKWEYPMLLSREHVLCGEIGAQCVGLGLYPPTDHEYFSSALGSPLRFVTTWVNNGSGRARVAGFTVEARGDILTVQVLRESTFKGPVMHNGALGYKYKKQWICDAYQRSASLLLSATEGTSFWKRCGPRSLREMPDIARPRIPRIAFDMPCTVQELADYWQWLSKLTGSRNRFRDGWGHMICMELVNKQGKLLLLASSAGPDGKWGTKDDMVLMRDTKTGKIVRDIPGRPDADAGVKANR